MKTNESKEQEALFDWAVLAESHRPELKLLHHIPNGGYRNKITAARLKCEGVKPGVPDLFLPVARGKFHGLYIEMKAEKGRLTDNQKHWIEKLRQNNYAVEVCWSWENAMKVIINYLDNIELAKWRCD